MDATTKWAENIVCSVINYLDHPEAIKEADLAARLDVLLNVAIPKLAAAIANAEASDE